MVPADFIAIVAVTLLVILTLFQIALALGAPLGAFAMGGAYPGVYPPKMRIAALVQAALYGVIGAAIATRAGWILPSYGHRTGGVMWALAALFLIGTILNLISRSKPERLLWTPVAAILCASCIGLAMAH